MSSPLWRKIKSSIGKAVSEVKETLVREGNKVYRVRSDGSGNGYFYSEGGSGHSPNQVQTINTSGQGDSAVPTQATSVSAMPSARADITDEQANDFIQAMPKNIREKTVNAIKKNPAVRGYAKSTMKYAEEFDVDPAHIMAKMFVESSFNRKAKNDEKKAQGLIQLLPGTAELVAKNLGLDPKKIDPYDPDTNIRLGIKYYKDQLDTFGKADENGKKINQDDLPWIASAAYHWGPDRDTLKKIVAKMRREGVLLYDPTSEKPLFHMLPNESQGKTQRYINDIRAALGLPRWETEEEKSARVAKEQAQTKGQKK